MSTRQRIDEIINNYPSGDVEDYFDHMNSLMQLNSGNNSYHMVTHVCHTNAAPLVNGTTQTHFHITDSGMDIVDIAKGVISLKISLDLEFKVPIMADGFLYGTGSFLRHYGRRQTLWHSVFLKFHYGGNQYGK